MLFTTTSEFIAIVQVFFPFYPRKQNAFLDRYQRISFTLSTTTFLQISSTLGTCLTTAIQIDASQHSYSIISIEPYIKKTTRRLTSSLWFLTIPLVMGRLQVEFTHINIVFSKNTLNPVSLMNNGYCVFYLLYSSTFSILIIL